MRPGDLRIADAGLPARVERVEDLGDSSIVSFIAGERLLKLKSDRLPVVREGDSVHLAFAPAAAHLFDRANRHATLSRASFRQPTDHRA